MQVTLESDEIADIVDMSIENALAPIRVENRRLWALVGQLQSAVDEQKSQTSSLSENIGNIKIPEQKNYNSELEHIHQKISDYVPIQDFVGLREQTLDVINNLKNETFSVIDNLRNEIDVVKEIRTIPGENGKDGKNGIDGQSFTLDDARPFIVSEVERMVSSIPIPQNGKDGAPGKDGIGLASAIVDHNGELIVTTTNGETKGLGVVVGHDGRDGVDGENGIDGQSVDIDEIKLFIRGEVEKVVYNIELPKDGIDGRNGENGESVTIDDVMPLIIEHINKFTSSIKLPKDGVNGIDGKNVDVEEIKSFIKIEIESFLTNLGIPKDSKLDIKQFIIDGVKEEIAALPLPKNGEDGKNVDFDAVQSLIVKEVEKIPRPRDGTSITLEDVSPVITDIIDKKFSSLSIPKDGKDGIGLAGALIDRNGELIVTCTNGTVISLGNVVGKDGKDVSNDMLDSIEREIFEVKKSVEIREKPMLTDDEFDRRVTIAMDS